MKLIILSKNEYKEKDSIITGINDEELITFSVKGLSSPKSKNAILANPLIIADVNMKEGNYKYPICESSMLLFSPYKLGDNLDKLAAISIISEATNKMLQDDEKCEMYDSLEKAIHALKDNKDPLQVVVTYLAQVLKLTGYEFELNECVFCGSKQNIVCFSFNEGGFICKDCYQKRDEYLFSGSQMLLLRKLFLNIEYKHIENTNKEDVLIILKEMSTFILDNLGIALKSFSLLN